LISPVEWPRAAGGSSLRRELSKELFERAKRRIPGGVNSPVRAFSPYPFFAREGRGSRIIDVDGNEYIDYCMGYGPLIFGHSPPPVVEAVGEALERGTLFGTPTEGEVLLAELIGELVPSMEKVRLVSTGAEATMHALRAARGETGRRKVVKFEGCYHGAYDYVLAKPGAGAFGIPTSEGIPQEATKNTIVVPFNDREALVKAVREDGGEIAAIIAEPVMGNVGPIPPEEGFLHFLREVCDSYGIVLIFDEVITGFRVALGGAQEYYGVTPDLTCLGKAMGGGLPIAAYGGRGDIMAKIAPEGKVYQAGTYSGNPVSVAASIAVLRALRDRRDEIYTSLARRGDRLREGADASIKGRGIVACVGGLSSMFQIFFTAGPVRDYASAQRCDRRMFARFHASMLDLGVFLPPSQFETCFLSTAHSDSEIEATISAIDESLEALARSSG